MKNYKRSSIILVVVIVGVVLVAVGGYFCYTQARSYQAKQSEIDSLKAQIKTL